MNSNYLIIVGGLLFWLMTAWAILDISRKDFGSLEKRAGWMILAALAPFIGVIAYLIFGYRKGIPLSKKPEEN